MLNILVLSHFLQYFCLNKSCNNYNHKEERVLLLGYFSSRSFSSDLTLFTALKRERWSLLTEIIKIFVLVCAFWTCP